MAMRGVSYLRVDWSETNIQTGTRGLPSLLHLCNKFNQIEDNVYRMFILVKKYDSLSFGKFLIQIPFLIKKCLGRYSNSGRPALKSNVMTARPLALGSYGTTLFNIYRERIMQETLENYNSTVSIGGRQISNLRFADDIDLMAGSNDDLQVLTDRLVTCASAYGMEVSAEKSKVMVNSRAKTHSTIKMNGVALENVEQFKYLGSTLTYDGTSNKEIKIRLAVAMAAMLRLNKIWKSNISI